jgi:hypothetical protein
VREGAEQRLLSEVLGKPLSHEPRVFPPKLVDRHRCQIERPIDLDQGRQRALGW